jgi:tRNA(Ile2) C34 agmatinyltransferase TiaS
MTKPAVKKTDEIPVCQYCGNQMKLTPSKMYMCKNWNCHERFLADQLLARLRKDK